LFEVSLFKETREIQRHCIYSQVLSFFFFLHLRTNIQIKQSERFTVSACSFHLGFGCAIQILETSLQTKNTAENNTDDKNLIVCISSKEGGEEKGGLSLIQGLIYKQPLASQQ
jgi:hypothetical protein